MSGKIDPSALADFIAATGAEDPDVLQGADYGEDAAAIDLGDRTLVVSADPLSLAADAVGRLAVHVACNDVAASGADPRWLTNTVFLPDDDPTRMGEIASQVDAAATEANVAIVGGHTEVLDSLARPLLSMTAFGTTDRFVPSGGVEPGDALLLTKGAGIEATAILATDFRAECLAAGVPTSTIDAAAEFLAAVSVIPDARAIRPFASAMHDPTEGGVLSALVELSAASTVTLVVERDRVPVRPETRACCNALDVDPLATFGSGALLAAVDPSAVNDALDALSSVGIDGAVIGSAVSPADGGSGATGRDHADEPMVLLDGEAISEPPRDECYPLWDGRMEP